jgi:4-amino-4-deoxy-L-arabinose transferase-like glycosyltransferase
MKDGNTTRVMLPIYPIGFPLHEALAVIVAGWQIGPFLINPLLASLSCWLLFRIALLLGLSRLLAFAAAVVMAVNPTMIYMAMQAVSDVTATFWALLLIGLL